MMFAKTERLLLRRPRPDDHPALLRSWSEPEMTRFTPVRSDPDGFIRSLIQEMEQKEPGETGPNGPWYQYVIERREGGDVIGDIGVGFGVPGERQVELGYRIHSDWQRQGYGREAVSAIIDHLIERHSIHRLVAVAAAENVASVSLLRALGLRQEGHYRQSFLCDGRWIDDFCFALLASEWPLRQSQP